NLDFADVKAVMSNRGNALMGTGRATGQGRAIEAAQAAVSSPLLEDVSISGAEGVLVNITGGRGLPLHAGNGAAGAGGGAAGDEANVIFGAVIDPNMDGELLITVIATGFGQAEPRLRLVQQQAARTTEEDMVRVQAWGQTREQGQNGRKSWERERAPRSE